MNISNPIGKGAVVSLAVLLALALAACGGGGGASGAGTASGPITAMTAGPAGGVTSITVGTRSFGTTHTQTVKLDDESGKLEDLEIGEVVIVRFEDEEAVEIEEEDLVQGFVDNVTPASGTLVVLGQRVLVDNTTRIREHGDGELPLALDAIATGDIVKVSGMFNADGDIAATRIERRSQGVNTFRVKGSIKNLNVALGRFDLGAFLHVAFTGAELEDLAAGGLANGLFVEAKAPPANYDPATFTLTATKIEGEEELENELEEENEAQPPPPPGMMM